MLSSEEVIRQSKGAFNQWKDLWANNARKNGEIFKKIKTSHRDYLYCGVGKTLLCVATAPSLEDQIEVIKQYADNPAIDIACNDKSWHMLRENGIKVKYVFVADAQVSYEDWLEPHLEETKDVTLFSNVTANPKWAENWKGDVVFYVNKDNIKTEEIYTKLSGCNELIPASSNVGNTTVVFSTQVFGYDEYLLVGYDFCWGEDDNYYAFNDNDKRYWMRHQELIDKKGRLVNSSHNLIFSGKWLNDYYAGVLVPRNVQIFDCSAKGVCMIPDADLENKMKNANIRKITDEEKEVIISNSLQHKIIRNVKELEKEINKRKENLVNVIIEYIPDNIKTLLQEC